MIPKCETAAPEQTFECSIDEIEKLLNKNYKKEGSTDKALNKLKQILDGLKPTN